jgi:hypothetical protein
VKVDPGRRDQQQQELRAPGRIEEPARTEQEQLARGERAQCDVVHEQHERRKDQEIEAIEQHRASPAELGTCGESDATREDGRCESRTSMHSPG